LKYSLMRSWSIFFR